MGSCSFRKQKNQRQYKLSDAEHQIEQEIISEQEGYAMEFIKSLDELNNLFQNLAMEFDQQQQSQQLIYKD